MARRKNQPEAVRVKCHLSERLREIRMELFGERGGSEMARRLGIPIRTWYNYESGVTVPAEVLLRFMELTAVESQWLLHGRGPKYRPWPAGNGEGPATVESLLRSALKQLELRTSSSEAAGAGSDPSPSPVDVSATEDAEGPVPAPCSAGGEGVRPVAARREWLAALREDRCVRVSGDAMAPIVSDGAQVAFSAEDESPEALEGALVVAWLDSRPVVRWFRRSGHYGLLRAENPESVPSIMLIDLQASPDQRRVRRVLWISTPH